MTHVSGIKIRRTGSKSLIGRSVAGTVRPFFLTAVTAVRSTSGGSADGLQELCARLQRLKHAQAAPQTLGKIQDFQKHVFFCSECLPNC